MSWKPDGLVFSTFRVEAYGPPSQRLEFVVQIESQLDETVVILGSDVSVRFDSVEIVEGPFLRPFQLEKGVFGLEPRRLISGVIRAPLSWRALRTIEERRQGKVSYSISGPVLVAPARESALGVPWEQQVGGRLGEPLKGEIAQSDWLEILRQLGWDETILIELPSTGRSEKYPRAREHLEDAVKQFRLGSWPHCLGSCRSMFDSLAGDKTPETRDEPDSKQLAKYFDSTQKGLALNNTLRDFRKFLNFGPHGHMPAAKVGLGRDDALLALQVSAAFLKYMSG